MFEFEKRLELLAHVAAGYYVHGKNQQEIANEIGMTRSAVSRLLSEAQKRGVVEHIIHYPWRTSPELEKELAGRFDLLHVRVLARQNKNDEEMLQALGVLAAQYFTSLLPRLRVVGITWGTGLYQMIRAIQPQSHPNLEVVQLIGGTGTEHGSAIGPLLAPMLANCLGCTCHFLHAPLVMENASARTSLVQDRSIRATLQRAASCDIALTGIGGLLPEIYNPYRLGYITLDELTAMRRDGLVGDVAALLYNLRGEILEDHWINRRIVGISAGTLKQIPMVLAVAGGAKKGEAIYGALRGRHVQALVTDDQAALRVLALDQASKDT